jgi:hypothetical protein
MADTVLPTTQQRFGIGAVVRHNFGKGPKTVTAKATVRYSFLSFNIDKTNAPGVTIPNVDYAYLEPGVGIRYPVSPEMAINAAGHFFIIQATGEIQNADTYGGAAVSGFDADVGGDYSLSSTIHLGGGLRYAAFNHIFDGSGAQTDRSGDGNQDVDSATDSYLSVYATASYLY